MPDNIRFDDLGLPPEVLTGVRAMGFTHPTPVQAAAIPEVLKGKDLMVQAKTGSGKTLAFGLPVLARLDPQSPDTQVLIIAPTRELAIQVAEELNKVGGHMGILVAAIYGGTKMDLQMTDLAWASIIVGTPGRLRDHLTRGNLHLEKCTTVVLDEADEMLDMGFKDDLEFILAGLPKPRVTLLFSATFPKAIETIARKYMTSTEKIAVNSGLTTPTDITHRFLKVNESKRIDALAALIQKEQTTLGIVFCKRKSETSSVARKLRAAGIQAGFLNGDMNQAQREATLAQFKRGEINILVATDVAARGLDINGISHVFNVSVPQDTETYVHRSGRTGRAGKKGTCITLVTPEEERYFAKIQGDLAESARKQAVAATAEAPAARPEPRTSESPRRAQERATHERPVERPAQERPAARHEEPREPRSVERPERRPPSTPQQPRRQELRDSRESREPRESREYREPREGREPRESRESREYREPRESQESREPRESRESRYSVDFIYREANGQAEAYKAIARDLLSQTEPERLVAALLSQTPAGQRMLEQGKRREESSEGDGQRRRSRSSSRGGRPSRKPSQYVYGD